MKKIILFISILLFFSTSKAFSDGHAIKKEGFFSKDFKITELSKIQDPENKIILINNHEEFKI